MFCIIIARVGPQILHLSLLPSSAIVWDSTQTKVSLLVLIIFRPCCGLSSHPLLLFFPPTTLFCFKQSACDNSKCVRIIRENLLDATDKADTLNCPWGEGWKTQLVLLTDSQMERRRSWSSWEVKREGLWSPAERLCPGEGTRWHEKTGSHEWGGWVRLHCWICGSGGNKEKQNQGCAENIYQMMQNNYCSVTTRAVP